MLLPFNAATCASGLTFSLREEFSCVGEIRENKEGCDGAEHSEEAFKNEDPRPPWLATNTIHLHDSSGEEPAKSSRNGRRGEEYSYTRA